ncbi:hypothetical protein DRO59_00365 [Candidatus Bathyarchaeota archaeon]|nr:MAG: hypothetical protein DRO59_00365 [Candidatus Bathyarchaeota archaeon]
MSSMKPKKPATLQRRAHARRFLLPNRFGIFGWQKLFGVTSNLSKPTSLLRSNYPLKALAGLLLQELA